MKFYNVHLRVSEKRLMTVLSALEGAVESFRVEPTDDDTASASPRRRSPSAKTKTPYKPTDYKKYPVSKTKLGKLLLSVLANGKPHPMETLKHAAEREGYAASSVASTLARIVQHEPAYAARISKPSRYTWVLSKE